MNPQALKKLTLDFIMTILLLLLMTYELIGRTTHEWLGTGMLLLVLIHHIFNHKWSKAVFKGKYTPYLYDANRTRSTVGVMYARLYD